MMWVLVSFTLWYYIGATIYIIRAVEGFYWSITIVVAKLE
jgi:hypothetical protein